MLRPQPPRRRPWHVAARDEPSCSLARAAERSSKICAAVSGQLRLDDALLLQAADCYSWSGASTAAACGLARLMRLAHSRGCVVSDCDAKDEAWRERAQRMRHHATAPAALRCLQAVLDTAELRIATPFPPPPPFPPPVPPPPPPAAATARAAAAIARAAAPFARARARLCAALRGLPPRHGRPPRRGRRRGCGRRRRRPTRRRACGARRPSARRRGCGSGCVKQD